MKIKPFSEFFANIHLFHKHKWILIGQTICEPNKTLANPATLNPDTFEKLIFGATTYIWECGECGDIRTKECRGVEKTTLEEALDKADLVGSHLLVREDKRYLISRQGNPVPQIPPDKIPIRRLEL